MIIGCSKPRFAKYASNGGEVTYSDGGIIGRLVNLNLSIEAANDNDFYSDNAKEVGDTTFGGGTLTMSTNDLEQDVSKVILGVREVAITGIDGITDDSPTELIWDNTQESPNLGVGFVVKHKSAKGVSWRGIVLRKVQFAIPADAATTQGKTIEWQTPELSASVYRDDTAAEAWKTEATFSTEAQALAYIDDRLNITAVTANANEGEDEGEGEGEG